MLLLLLFDITVLNQISTYSCLKSIIPIHNIFKSLVITLKYMKCKVTSY